MRTGKKISIMIVLSAAFFMLTGFELFQDVDLSYKKPLIDLYGNTSPENPFFIPEEPNTLDAEDIDEKPDEGQKKEAQERHIIGVKNKTITLDGRETDLKEAEDFIKKNTGRNTVVMLWDNYAEYYTFSDVREMLLRLKPVRKYSLEERALEVKP